MTFAAWRLRVKSQVPESKAAAKRNDNNTSSISINWVNSDISWLSFFKKESPKHWPSTGPPVELLVDHLLLLIVAKIQVGWAAHGTKALCKLLKVRIGTASIVVLNFWCICCVETGPQNMEKMGWPETRPVHILSWWFIIFSTESCKRRKAACFECATNFCPQNPSKSSSPCTLQHL